MKRFTSHFSHFALFFFTVTTMNTTLFAMKRTIDAVSSCADTALSFCGLPEDLSRLLLSPCRKSDLIVMCKQWAQLFSFSNWKTILCTQPGMLTRHPRDCERIYYRLMRENDLATMKILLEADAQAKKHMRDLLKHAPLSFDVKDMSEEMRQLMVDHSALDTLSGVMLDKFKIRGKVPCEDYELVKSIFYNDIEGMKKYLQRATPSQQLIDLQENINIVARYVSIPMLEVLEPILEKTITVSDDSHAVAQDCIVAKAAMKCNGHRVEIVEHLLTDRAGDAYDWGGESAIEGAVVLAHEKNDYSLLELLVRHGLDVDPDPRSGDRKIHFTDGDYLPALEWAVMKNNACLVHMLLHLGADPDLDVDAYVGEESEGLYLLHRAQELGNAEIIRALKFASMKKSKDSVSAH
jgi:hypothetical protein